MHLAIMIGGVTFWAACIPGQEAKLPASGSTPTLEHTNSYQPSSTPTPEPTSTATSTPDIGPNRKEMEEARDEGMDVFITRDPGGIDVVVNVVPPEVVEQGEWSWELRGFTREVAGQVQVWRTLQGREAELSQWFDVVSLLEVPGHGTLTIEFDREVMADKRLTEIWLQHPQDWKTVLDIFWGTKETSKVAEPSDYGLIHEKIINREVIPPDIYSFESVVRGAGTSFVLYPDFEPSFNQAENWSGEPGVGFKNTAQAGRPVLFMYIKTWVGDSQEWPGFPFGIRHVGIFGPANVDYFVNQAGQAGVESMIRTDRNPWIYSGKRLSPRVERAYEEINAQDPAHFYFSPLFGPRP